MPCCYCLGMEHTAVVINNLNRFLIWCYSHKLLCFSIYESSGWVVLFLFWFARCDSILVVVQYPHRAMTLKTYHFWSVTIEPSVCHLAIYILLCLNRSFFLWIRVFIFPSCLELHCALIMHVILLCALCAVHDVVCDLCVSVYLLRISFYINRYKLV